jgi:hypothetical protein
MSIRLSVPMQAFRNLSSSWCDYERHRVFRYHRHNPICWAFDNDVKWPTAAYQPPA